MFAQFRLYFIAGAAVLALGIVGAILWQFHSLSSALSASEAARIAATDERDQAIDANKANTAALAQLAMSQALNNKLLTDLSDGLDKVRADVGKISTDRTKLAQANPDVKAFLNTPVPPAMRVRPAGSKTGIQN